MAHLITFRILDSKSADKEHPIPVSYGVVNIDGVNCTTGRDGRCSVEAPRAGTFPVWFRHENYRPILNPAYITIPSDEEYTLKATRARF